MGVCAGVCAGVWMGVCGWVGERESEYDRFSHLYLPIATSLHWLDISFMISKRTEYFFYLVNLNTLTV